MLAELELTSTARAGAIVPMVSGSAPTSTPPNGDDTPARYWRKRFALAGNDHELRALIDEAWRELRGIRRRTLAALAYEDGGELDELILDRGEGFEPTIVAVNLRCTPTRVRRARIARGRDPEHGHVVELDALDPRALIDAGLSIRQTAAVLGLPRSTLHGRLVRTA